MVPALGLARRTVFCSKLLVPAPRACCILAYAQQQCSSQQTSIHWLHLNCAHASMPSLPATLICPQAQNEALASQADASEQVGLEA